MCNKGLNNKILTILVLAASAVVPTAITYLWTSPWGPPGTSSRSARPASAAVIGGGAISIHSGSTEPMRNRHEHLKFFVLDPHSKLQRFKRFRNDPRLLAAKQYLAKANLLHLPAVQKKCRLAQYGTAKTREKKLIELLQLIEDYKVRLVEYDDSFMPYATADQISNGGRGVHVFNQANNGIPFNIDPYTYCLLWLLLGPQGAGKSSATFYQLMQLPGTPKLLLDPKGTWEDRAEQLGAEVIPPEYLQFDLGRIEEGLLSMYLHSVMEGVAQATGLQYGLSFLFEACDIALEQRRRFIEQTGQETPLCLKDIHSALSLCEAKNPTRTRYLESARTALELLLGRNNLFTTRCGQPLDELFSGNYILQCRYLTTTQSRFLGWFLLNYRYFKSFGQPETTQLQGLVVFEDASKFISRPDNIFGSGARTSNLLHILSVLRSTGRGCIFVSQQVESISGDIKGLCSNWLVVGGVHGGRDQSEVASAMGLTRGQAAMLGRLGRREAVCFCPSTYPYAVHGFIPDVTTIYERASVNEPTNKIWAALQKWHPLTEIPAAAEVFTSQGPGDPSTAAASGSVAAGPPAVRPRELSPSLFRLLVDVQVYPFSSISVRIKRLGISAREFEAAKLEGLEKGLIVESAAGQLKYLILTQKGCDLLDMPCPFDERNVSLEHSYYVLWTRFMLEKDPSIKAVQVEVRLGLSGSTSDAVSIAHDGTRYAWEVTLSTTNVLANASKYVGTDFVKVIFLCRDYRLKEAVKACCREGGLDPDLLARLDFMHFSQLLRRQRRLSLY